MDARQELPGRSGMSRARFVRWGAGGAAVAAAAVTATGLPRVVSAAGGRSDVEALDLLLLVEYAEVGLYAAAADAQGLGGKTRKYVATVLPQERAHLKALQQALGGKARSKPALDFGDATSGDDAFAATAAKLEDVAVGAYNGQAANVSAKAFAAAAQIVSVEARHAAWIRAIAGRPPAPEPTDAPLDAAAVRKRLRELGVQG
jgi:Ferritin-like domain